MARTRVRAPDGTFWTIRRRWIPHREGIGLKARLLRRGRHRRRRADRPGDERARWYDWVDVPADLDAVAFVIVLVLAVLFLVFVGWPIVLIGIDLAWVTLVLIAGTIGRVVLGRPWRVEARSDAEVREWFVTGFRAAGRLRDDLANQFRHGANPVPAIATALPDLST